MSSRSAARSRACRRFWPKRLCLPRWLHPPRPSSCRTSLLLKFRRQLLLAVVPRFHHISELLTGVEHTRLHRRLRNADIVGDLFHRPLVIIDEVDYRGVFRGKLGQTAAENLASILVLQGSFRIVRRPGVAPPDHLVDEAAV